MITKLWCALMLLFGKFRPKLINLYLHLAFVVAQLATFILTAWSKSADLTIRMAHYLLLGTELFLSNKIMVSSLLVSLGEYAQVCLKPNLISIVADLWQRCFRLFST